MKAIAPIAFDLQTKDLVMAQQALTHHGLIPFCAMKRIMVHIAGHKKNLRRS